RGATSFLDAFLEGADAARPDRGFGWGKERGGDEAPVILGRAESVAAFRLNCPDEFSKCGPQRLVEVPREVAPEMAAANQANDITQVFGSEDVLVAALKLHVNQVCQADRADSFNVDDPPRWPGDEITRHQFHRDSVAQEFPAPLVELKPFGDQEILKGLRR